MENNKTICLCMMVRNESHVIKRALESAKPHIDYWVIVDTGSTDNTEEIIQQTLLDIPGELHHSKWVDFGHNRTEVVRLARNKAAYLLILDADMAVNVYAPFKHKLTADAYEIRYEGDESYTQHMLVAAHHNWHYVGVTHEYIDAPTKQYIDWMDELTLTHFADGGMRSDKFERDIRLLTEDLQKDPGNARSLFYLAQSYKDLGKYKDALYWYEQRAAMENSWDEERWFAQMQAGRMKLLCNYPWDEAVQALLKAYAMRPSRAEPIYTVVRYLREQGSYQLAWQLCAFAANGMPLPPRDILFIDTPVYRYLLQLEYAVCAYANAYFAMALSAFNSILGMEGLPADVENSAIRGRKLCLAQLFPPKESIAGPDNRIMVVTIFNNPGDALNTNVQQLLAQNYPDTKTLFINDASTDESPRYLPQANGQITLIHHAARQGYAASLHEAITGHCDADDIVVIVNGEDWLAGADALSQVNAFYQQQDCWVMYGQFNYSTGQKGDSQPFASVQELQQHRQQPRVSRLNSFRAGLYQSIAMVDPSYECLKNEKGQWLTAAPETAMMVTLMELAGFDRIRYLDAVLGTCTKNIRHPDNWLQANLMKNNLKTIAAKRPFIPLPSYRYGIDGTAGLEKRI
ncbi:MAG: hypothetical protein CTY16_20695 [Methylobacter sp.]|nr:MAG: hypothetical protein CTY16_20695 [Methylobacter sp.]